METVAITRSVDDSLLKGLYSVDDLEFHLVTMGQSDNLYTQGGHNAIRVISSSGGSDFLVHWGMFYFTEPNFLYKMFKEQLTYYFFIENSGKYFQKENKKIPRDIFQTPLYLTVRQKEKFIEILKRWFSPENQGYSYHIWNRNCSTILRDVLDEVTNGAVKRIYSDTVGTPTSIRKTIARNNRTPTMLCKTYRSRLCFSSRPLGTVYS
tara:strand:+ start:353 stop:976 length:624 start_codon:yes stop_codon:yes gene_type:complete